MNKFDEGHNFLLWGPGEFGWGTIVGGGFSGPGTPSSGSGAVSRWCRHDSVVHDSNTQHQAPKVHARTYLSSARVDHVGDGARVQIESRIMVNDGHPKQAA